MKIIVFTLSMLLGSELIGINVETAITRAKEDEVDFERSDSVAKELLKEAEANFTLNGKPIHPGCVQEFEVSLADSPPPIVKAVDVASCVSSNKFYMPYSVGENGYISYENAEPSGEKEYFAYKYIGRASSGIHILDTKYSGGGTLVAMTIYLIRFDLGKYAKFENTNQLPSENRLIMKGVGQIIRGDRDSGLVELNGDKLILGKSQYRDKRVVIDLK